MVIKRYINGKDTEIELTPQEVLDAYYQQEHSFDEDDVRDRFNEWDDERFLEYGVTRAEAEEQISDIAYEKRRIMNKYDTDWEYALDEAISTVLGV